MENLAITFSVHGNPAYLKYAVISIGNLIQRGVNKSNIFIFIHSSLINFDECVQLHRFGINIIFSQFVSKFLSIINIFKNHSKFTNCIHVDVDCSYSGDNFYTEIEPAISSKYFLVQGQPLRKLNCLEIFEDRKRLFKHIYKTNQDAIVSLFNVIKRNDLRVTFNDFEKYLKDKDSWVYGGIIFVNKEFFSLYKDVIFLLDSVTHCDESILILMEFLYGDIYSLYDFKQRVCDDGIDFNKVQKGFNHFSSVDFRNKKKELLNMELKRIEELFNLK